MEDLYLKPLKFNGKIGKYFMNTYYINLICEKGNLKNVLLKLKLEDFDKYIYKEVMDDRLWKESLLEDDKIEKFNLLKEKAKKDYNQEVENFLPILFNQTLVMFCTIFDNFLEDCLDVITSAKLYTVKLLSTKEDKDILEAIEKNIDSTSFTVYFIIRKKILEKFAFGGIEKKLNTFERLGLKKSIIFKLNEKMALEYPNAYGFLKDVYKKRNDIVHKDLLPLKKYEDLANIHRFFNHFILKFSLDAFKLFDIKIDLQLMMSGKKIDSN